MLTEFVRVADISELDDPDMMMVEAEGHEFLLVKIKGEYYVADDICTHAFALLDQGDLIPDEFAVQCPLHEGVFDMRTGEVIRGLPEDPITMFAVRIEGNDILIGPK